MICRIVAPSFRIACLAIVVVLVPAIARAGAWLPGRGDYYTELRGSFLSSDSFHDFEGNRGPSATQYESREMRAHIELGWRKSLSFVLGMPTASVTVRNGSDFETSTGFADLDLGLRYGIMDGAQALSIEVDWRTPMGYHRQQSVLGDGRQVLAGRVLFGGPIATMGFYDLSGGYSYRYLTIGGSEETPTNPVETTQSHFIGSADAGFWVGGSLLIGGRYQGKILAGGDGPDDNQIEKSLHLAGPIVLYRPTDFLDVMAGSWSTAAGQNARHYDQFYVAVAFKQTRLNRLQGFLGGSRGP